MGRQVTILSVTEQMRLSEYKGSAPSRFKDNDIPAEQVHLSEYEGSVQSRFKHGVDGTTRCSVGQPTASCGKGLPYKVSP